MKRLQKLFVSSPQGIIFTNGRGEITNWNPAAENIFGLSGQEAIGKNLSDIVESQGQDFAARWGKNESGSDHPLQGKVVSTSGEVHLVEFLIAASEVDEQGEPFKVIMANDISHHWLREEQLEMELRLQVVMNTILHVAMLDKPLLKQLTMLLDLILAIPTLKILPMGAILIAEDNPKHLRLWVHKGLSEEHVKTCSLVPVGSCYCGRAVAEEVVSYEGNFILPAEWGDAPCRKLYPEAVHYSIPIRTETQVLGVLVLFLERPVSGPHPELETMLAVANVLASVMERAELQQQQLELISHLRATNKSLRAEKKFSESIIASLLNGLLILDNNEVVAACNPVGQKILGKFFPGDLLGRRLDDIVGKDLAGILLHNSAECKPADAVRQTIELTGVEGEVRLIEYVSFPRLDDSGVLEGSIICFSDITEADRLLRKMEKMNRFSTIAEIASAVAHEVRNPLTGIKAISQGVESQLAPDDKNREHLNRITKQVDRLNVLLTDFFTYARPPKPQKKAADIRDIVDKVVPLLHSRAQKNSITINNLLASDLPTVVVDANQMQQVFLNIFLNAMDAMRSQGVIEISAENIGLDRKVYDETRFPGLNPLAPYLVVMVSDTGEGMTPEVQEKLFEPFFTTKTSGTGLGLAIVMRIMKGHDAYIYAESPMQKGSTFFLFFRTN